MEPEITERVGEPSSRRPRPPRQQTRKSLAESPLPLPRSSQKKRKRRKESAEYYSVKRILDEKTEHDEISYLIDWEENPESGESYAPTWEPSDNVNRQAINEWLARNRQVQVRTEKQRRTEGTSRQQPSSFDPYPASQPIRTAKRQRTNRPPNPSSSSHPPANKPRRAGTVETARFQSVSQEIVNPEGKPKEIKDSYEDEQSLSSGSGRIRVEIPVDQGFDREAYARVTVVSSQPSQGIQTSQNSESSRPSYTPSQSQFKTLTPRPFLWDEEDDGIPIIPDSQEPPGSSSYKPTETPTSKSGVTTRPSIGTNTEAEVATWRSSAVSVGFASTGYRHSEPPSYFSRASNFGNESEATSSQVESSVQPSIDAQHFSTSVEESQESQHLDQSRISEPVEDPILSDSSRATPEASVSASSSHLPSSSETHLPSRGTWSQEAAHALSQVQPSSSEVDHVSELQTQLPVASPDENGTSNSSLHVTQGSHIDEILHNRQSARSETESQIVGRDLVRARSAAPTQRPVSSFDAPCQAAQTRSVSPRYYTQDAQIIFEEDQSSPATVSQDTSSQVLTIPALNNLDANAQKSPPKSQDRVSSAEGSASLPNPKGRDSPSEASENVLPSIEHVVETVSSPTPSRPSPPSSRVLRITRYYTPSPRSSPSNKRMADQAMSEMSTAEKLKLARQAAAENTMARQRAARTASAIPHTPPPPGPPPVNQMLPLRETAPEATVISAPSPRASPEREVPPTSLQILPLGENVYTVPLPMVSFTRDIYNQVVTNHRPQRRSFLNDDEIDTQLVADIDTMTEHLRKICDHPDLIDEDSATQQMEPDHRQARWAENTSTKCMFLAGFFDSLRSINTHVLVLARPGRMMDILEALFRTHGYIYTRPDRPSSQSGQGLLKISLLPTDTGERNFGLEPASMVIAFDSTFLKGPYVESLRTDPAKANRLTPRVHLVITHSIEHLELCIKKDMNQVDRKAILVNSLSHVREEMGKLDTDYLQPEPAAKAVADFLVDGASGEWPLLPMPYIEGLESVPETPAEPNLSEAQPSESTTQSYDISPASLQPAFKRPLLDEEDSESSKRQRLTPVGGVSNSGVDVSQVNETTLDTSAGAGNLSSEALATREIVTKADALDATQEDQISPLLKKISELENQLRSKEATETELRQFNQRLEARCQDYEKSFATIQPKYQEALNERGQVQNDIEESIARETSMRQKLDARTADLAKVREEKSLADAALVDARAILSSSSIPEVAELQKLRDELIAAKSETGRWQKKLNTAQGDTEYMRINYQKASSAVAEMRTELDALKTLNETLSRKASANAVEIHRIQASSEIKQHLQHISELEGEKAELERELEKRTEELKSVLNGRRPTRGSSVPKSPRLPTMSPGQSSRPMARVLSGVGSRGTSPAPGGAEGQFRGPSTFGDALFAPMPGSNRWGNHLN